MFSLPEAKEGDFPRESTASRQVPDGTDSDHFAKGTSSDSATDATMEAASAIAAVGSRIVLDKEWTESVTDAWRQSMEENKLWETQHKLEHRVEKYPLVDYLEPLETAEHHCSC
jgi:DMSO/TMAO reductase YedYZ molybdopterin-dependent catalytic subunit